MWSLRGWELGGQVISLREAYIQNLSLLGSLDPFKKFVVGGWVVVSRPILVISLKFKSRLIKINFHKRKWNYPNRKWNYFSHFQTSNKKTSFTKYLSFDPRGSKLIFKTGNGIIQTGNGIISPTSRPLMKKLLLQNVSHLIQGVQN